MQITELSNWIGLSLLVLSGACLSLIAVRNTLFKKQQSQDLLSVSLSSADKKYAKYAGLLFFIGILFFLVGGNF